MFLEAAQSSWPRRYQNFIWLHQATFFPNHCTFKPKSLRCLFPYLPTSKRALSFHKCRTSPICVHFIGFFCSDCDRHRPCFHDHLDRQQLHPAQPPPAVCGPPRAEQRGRATPPRPTGNALSNAARETVCCLCHKGMLLAQAQLGVHQVPPKVLFRQAAPQLSQHVLVPGVVPPQVQDSTLPLLNYSQGRRANKQYKKTTLSSFLFKNLLFCFGLCIVWLSELW